MRKANRRRWRTLMLIVFALILGAGLLIQGVGMILGWLTPDGHTAGSDRGAATSICTGTQHGPMVAGSLRVDKPETECGDLTLFGSTLDVNGQVQGDILAFGSNINIAGNVSGNIDLYGGIVTLQNGSHMRGNIHVFGGSEQLEKGSHLEGEIEDQSQHVSLWVPGLSSGFVFPFWSIVVWVALGLLLTSLLPEHVMFVRTTVTTKARRSLLLGLLSLLLAPAVLVVLIALIIPIPLAILVAIGLIAAWALGTIAIGWLVGEYIMRAVAPRHNTRPAQVTVGLTILVLVGSLPYVGWIVSIGAGLLGLGAVFLSRFGTRLYTQPKHPLTF